MSDIVKRLRNTANTRREANASQYASEMLLVCARLSKEDAALLHEAAARIEELERENTLALANSSRMFTMMSVRIEELEAKLATARNDALEEAALASEMWTCAKCGAIFHPEKNPHTDANCAVGHSSWDGPLSSDEATAAIRALKSTTQP